MRAVFLTYWPRLIRFFSQPFWVLIPFGWLILFFLIPFATIFKISFSEPFIGLPPYAPLMEWVGDWALQIRLTFANYRFIIFDNLYLMAYFNSLLIALWATCVCILIGYPMAYAIMRADPRFKNLLLMLIILPFWTSFLVRVYAWIGLLSPQGLLNNLLIGLKIIHAPLPLMGNVFAVGLGIVYSYLPFMILPLYASLEKIDPALLEAAFDLGCRPFHAFWKIIVPLSLPGAISGAMLVFIPAVGEFVIPELLGGSQTLMIGRVLWNEFFYNRDWPVASALAVLMLLLLLIPMIIFQRLQNREEDTRQA